MFNSIKKIALLCMVAIALPALAAIWRGPDGIVYGNICVVQMMVNTPQGPMLQTFTQIVNPLPVGQNCWAPNFNSWGYIANF